MVFKLPGMPTQQKGWTVDWSLVEAFFPELASLAGCPQDPIWHPEGDVLTHTRLVAESLASSEFWRQMPRDERTIVFAAALLHDIAKPRCTREESGRLRSPNHTRRGAQDARWILDARCREHGIALTFEQREAVVQLVRNHARPLYHLERVDPDRLVTQLSYLTRCDWLATLVEADVNGRICDDQSQLLDGVELFRDHARELGCLTAPRVFASDHTRFRYFGGADIAPRVELFDDRVCEVIMMSGLPGAGKDTWIRDRAPDLPCVSLDSIRDALDVDPKANQGRVVQAGREQAREYLRKKRSFIWNATNVSLPIRQSLVRLFTDYKARIHIVYVEAAMDDILVRNAKRPRPVPDAVIKSLARRLEIPTLLEAHRLTLMTW